MLYAVWFIGTIAMCLVTVKVALWFDKQEESDIQE